MKKVNFNALQNFEVPESWIENAINAKPKKKLFHLNPLHLSTAACLVIAVSNSIFSPLNLNRNFTPLTGSIVEEAIVEGSDNSSTFTYPKNADVLTQNEINTTFLVETTKSTEKPNATGVTEQNEEIYEQEINSEEQDNESSESENHSPVRNGATEQREQPGRNEQENNTKKPEQTTPLREPANPSKELEITEPIQETNGNSGEEQESNSPQEEYNKEWEYLYSVSDDSNIGQGEECATKPFIAENEKFFKNYISFDFSEIKDKNLNGIVCYVTSIDNTAGVKIQGKITINGPIQEKIKINLSQLKDREPIHIPCGEYSFIFKGVISTIISNQKIIEQEKDLREFSKTLDNISDTNIKL